MAICYTERSFRSESVKKTITLPTKWAMYTYFGNKRITDLASKFLKVAENDGGFLECTKAGIEFLRKYREMVWSKSKCYGESSDTAVRESVWCFFERVCNALNIDGDKIWDCPEAQEQINKKGEVIK